MKLALDNHIRKIAFPSISTGAYSYPVDQAARIAVQTVMKFLEEHPEDFDLAEWGLLGARTEAAYKAELN